MFQLTYISFFHPFPSKNIKIRALFLVVSFSQNQGNQNGQQKKDKYPPTFFKRHRIKRSPCVT